MRGERDAADEMGLAEPPDRRGCHQPEQGGGEIGEHRGARDREHAGVGDPKGRRNASVADLTFLSALQRVTHRNVKSKATLEPISC